MQIMLSICFLKSAIQIFIIDYYLFLALTDIQIDHDQLIIMGRMCAVIGCANSIHKLDHWYSQLCDRHGCKFGSCICKPPFILYPFPSEKKNPDGRRRWAKLVNRKNKSGHNWQPNYQDRICSEHFKDGEPTKEWPDPTEKLGYDAPGNSSAKSPRNPPKERVEYIPKKRVGKRKRDDTPNVPCTDFIDFDDSLPQENAEIVPVSEDLQPEQKDHLGDHNYYSKYDTSCTSCIEKQSVIEDLKLKNYHHQQKIKAMKFKQRERDDFVTSVVTKNDISVNRYTGIASKKKLQCLHHVLAPKVKRMKYWSGTKKESSPRTTPKRKCTPQKPGPARTLTSLQEFILVLMKLRLGLTLAFLGSLFLVSSSTASQVFNTWIKFLAQELKCLIRWPDLQAVRTNIPDSLKNKYNNLRCTVDCTEIFIERPRHLRLQAQTWSEYKRHNTVKFLVAIAPNGLISFLSDVWGGRATDVQITRESGFLNLIDPGDLILADRGFIIKEDLLVRQAKLEIPPPSKGIEQQTPEDVAKTKKIANARIHVERAIGRMKLFSILQQTLPISLVPLIDDIVVVCAALVNLQEPLVK